ncbi:MAG: FAD-dependent oxidoreductase [Deltaproteobacteria bacterium]|nr:FAD-dependent oxidoreductase [Deltaproteobacteria bacterium]
MKKPTAEYETVILGAGLAGLSAALHLERDYIVVEQGAAVGGLAQTDVVDGFYFDRTGHWLHLRDPGIKAMVDEFIGHRLVNVVRKSKIFSHGVYTHYPFQANTYGLPPKVVEECLLGFITAPARTAPARGLKRLRDPKNFEEFIFFHFGEGIARHFMIPYNTKLWGVPPREITSEWCSRFVPRPTIDEVVRGALGLSREQIGYNATYLYPKDAGIDVLPQALAVRVSPLRLSTSAVAIDLARRQVTLSSGETLAYRHLISTLPLPALVAMSRPVTATIRTLAKKLRHTSVMFANFGVRGRAPIDSQWIYYPETRFPFYRAGIPTNAVAALAPPGHYSLYVEVSHRGELVADKVLPALRAAVVDAGLVCDARDIVVERMCNIPCAYVIFDDNYFRGVRTILPWLARQGVLSTGRYGKWTYCSMEDAMMMGREAAADVRRGARGRRARKK